MLALTVWQADQMFGCQHSCPGIHGKAGQWVSGLLRALGWGWRAGTMCVVSEVLSQSHNILQWQMRKGCCQSHPLMWQLCFSLLRMISLAPFSDNNSEESNDASVLVLKSGSEQSYQPSPFTEFWFAAAQACDAHDLVSFRMKQDWKMCT